MIEFTDYDASRSVTLAARLPAKVTKIEVSHDGGRFYVAVNGVEVFNVLKHAPGLEARDCSFVFDDQAKPR